MGPFIESTVIVARIVIYRFSGPIIDGHDDGKNDKYHIVAAWSVYTYTILTVHVYDFGFETFSGLNYPLSPQPQSPAHTMIDG